MKKKMTKKICCTVSVLTLAAVSAGTVSAATASDNNKCGGENVAVANVESELLIRKTASDEGRVVGYLPSASGVIVESMDEEWTKVRSGSISGYVKTDYLAFGEKAEELKNVYGILGAVASWNDVKVFSDYEDTSSVIGSIDEGEGFEVLGSTDNWVEVQLADGNTAYVAAEDVELTPVLDTAVSTGEYEAAPASAAQTAAQTQAVMQPEENDVQAEAENEYIYDEAYAETGNYEETAEDAYVTPDSGDYGETAEDAYVTPETESYGSEEYTEPADDTYTAEETESYETEDDTYVDPETEIYDDGVYETEVIDETIWEDSTPETEAADTTDDNDGLTGDEYIDPSTEADDTDTSSSSVNADDAALLAALIYCEAGNQSEEGKVAVGQVVMNRVESGSFANSIHDVIYESGQFTPAMTGWLDQVVASGEVPSECYDAAVAAMNGEGTVGDALYFNGGSGKGQQIGDHQFY